MAGRRLFFRRRKTCPFSGADAPKIDYKDVKLLSVSFPNAAKSFRAVSLRFRPRNSANWRKPLNVPVSWRCCRIQIRSEAVGKRPSCGLGPGVTDVA